MIFGLDETTCASDIELTGMNSNQFTNAILITGFVKTISGCPLLGISGTGTRGFIAYITSYGIVNWVRMVDLTSYYDTLITPKFLTYLEGVTTSEFAFAILVKKSRDQAMTATSPYQMTAS
jgi:hypothetical protein